MLTKLQQSQEIIPTRGEIMRYALEALYNKIYRKVPDDNDAK